MNTEFLRKYIWCLAIIMAPFFAAPIYNVMLLAQDQTVDPWLYTAYGRMLKEMVATSGWTYYSVRFPVIAPISFFNSIFTTPIDYIALRYCVYLLCVAPFFVLVRWCYGVSVAVASLSVFVCVPWFVRIIAWDLTTFIGVPACVAGICMWLMPSRNFLWRIGAGFAFAAALNSHLFSGVVLLCFFATEFASAVWFRRVKSFVMDCSTALVGFVACLALGLVYYKAAVGSVSAMQLLSVAVGMVSHGMDYHDKAMAPGRDILFSASIIFLAPVVVVLLALALAKGALLDTVAARILWFSASLCIFFFVFHFALNKNVLGYFHYSCYMFPAFALSIPVLIASLSARRKSVIVGYVVAVVCAPLFVSVMPFQMLLARGKPAFLLPIVAVGAVACLAVWLFRSRVSIGTLAGGAVAVLVQIVVFSDLSVGGMFNRSDKYDFAVYKTADGLSDVVKNYDKPGKRMLIWYPKGDMTTFSIGFLNLGNTLAPPFSYNETGMPEIGEYENQRLSDPTVMHVLLLSQKAGEVDKGAAAIQVHSSVTWHETLRYSFGKLPYRLDAVVISKPAS